MLASGVLFQILFHYKLSQDIEYSSLCYIYIGPCCLFLLDLKKFISLFLAVLDLCCCTGFFSSYSKRGLLSSCGVRASGGGFSCGGARALGHMGFSSCGSQTLEHRLSSCGACV